MFVLKLGPHEFLGPQVQGFGLSSTDQVKFVGDTDACSAPAVSSSSLAIAQATLSTGNTVIVTQAQTVGAYKLCVQLSGQSTFAEIVGRLTVRGES